MISSEYNNKMEVKNAKKVRIYTILI